MEASECDELSDDAGVVSTKESDRVKLSTQTTPATHTNIFSPVFNTLLSSSTAAATSTDCASIHVKNPLELVSPIPLFPREKDETTRQRPRLHRDFFAVEADSEYDEDEAKDSEGKQHLISTSSQFRITGKQTEISPRFRTRLTRCRSSVSDHAHHTGKQQHRSYGFDSDIEPFSQYNESSKDEAWDLHKDSNDEQISMYNENGTEFQKINRPNRDIYNHQKYQFNDLNQLYRSPCNMTDRGGYVIPRKSCSYATEKFAPSYYYSSSSNVISGIYEPSNSIHVAQPLLSGKDSTHYDGPSLTASSLAVSFIRTITSPIHFLIPSVIFKKLDSEEQQGNQQKSSTSERPLFRRYRNVKPSYPGYSFRYSKTAGPSESASRRILVRRRYRTGVEETKDKEGHEECMRTLSEQRPIAYERLESSRIKSSSSGSLASSVDDEKISVNRKCLTRNTSAVCWTNKEDGPVLEKQITLPSRRKITRMRQKGSILSKNLRKASRHTFTKSVICSDGPLKGETGRSKWREVVGFCEAQRYDLKSLRSDLLTADVFCEFTHENGTILRIDGSQLLDSQILDQSNKIPISGDQQCEASAAQLLTVALDSVPDDSKGRNNEMFQEEQVNLFVFENGVSIVWGLRDAEQNKNHTDRLSAFLSKYSEAALHLSWQSRFCMTFCLIKDLPSDFPVPGSRVKHERFYLKKGNIDEQLAASLALAQSTRLTAYEEAVEETIRKFGKLPLRIAANEFYEYLNYGSTEGTNIRKWVAEVYNLVIDVNIVEDFLDVPEYFWHNDQSQSFWKRVHRYLDVAERIQILNVRVGCIQEILKVVSNERVEAQGVHLAWCVIILLTVNVVAIIIREMLDRRR